MNRGNCIGKNTGIAYEYIQVENTKEFKDELTRRGHSVIENHNPEIMTIMIHNDPTKKQDFSTKIEMVVLFQQLEGKFHIVPFEIFKKIYEII